MLETTARRESRNQAQHFRRRLREQFVLEQQQRLRVLAVLRFFHCGIRETHQPVAQRQRFGAAVNRVCVRHRC